MKEKLKIGDKVRWNDPAIEDNEPENKKEFLSRIFKITNIYSDEEDDIEDDTICYISDGFTEAEVYASELEKINQ